MDSPPPHERRLVRGILGRLSSGQRADEVESIVAHLRDLLNTRLGESLSAPTAGVVDFADVVHGFPEAAQTLQRSIRDAIQRFEPRLRNVTVRLVDGREALTLVFEISARLAGQARGESLRVSTELTSDGLLRVSGEGAGS